MKQIKLTFDFKRMANGVFENKCTLILSSPAGNKYFPKPAPSLKELEAAMKSFSAASALATDGSKMDRKAREFTIKQGKISGTIKGSFADVSWAKSYGYEYTRTPIVDTNWKTVSGSNCRFELSGMERGVEYAVRICVKGSKGKILYSPVLTILVV